MPTTMRHFSLSTSPNGLVFYKDELVSEIKLVKDSVLEVKEETNLKGESN